MRSISDGDDEEDDDSSLAVLRFEVKKPLNDFVSYITFEN